MQLGNGKGQKLPILIVFRDAGETDNSILFSYYMDMKIYLHPGCYQNKIETIGRIETIWLVLLTPMREFPMLVTWRLHLESAFILNQNYLR